MTDDSSNETYKPACPFGGDITKLAMAQGVENNLRKSLEGSIAAAQIKHAEDKWERVRPLLYCMTCGRRASASNINPEAAWLHLRYSAEGGRPVSICPLCFSEPAFLLRPTGYALAYLETTILDTSESLIRREKEPEMLLEAFRNQSDSTTNVSFQYFEHSIRAGQNMQEHKRRLRADEMGIPGRLKRVRLTLSTFRFPTTDDSGGVMPAYNTTDVVGTPQETLHLSEDKNQIA